MNDDTPTPLEPRLPEDPVYWDELSTRITDGAAAVLAELGEGATARTDIWWAVLAERAPALAAAAAVSMVAGSLALAGGSTATDASPYDEIARAIGPSDQIAQTFFADASPPAVESLLPLLADFEEDR